MSANEPIHDLREILQAFIMYARSRGYNLLPQDFSSFPEDVLRREYDDLLRYGVNSWITEVVGEGVAKSHSKAQPGR